MAIQSISVHGQILEADLTPAIGTVTFRILQELRDTVDNIVLAPTEFVATLDVNGEFTITLPTTDNPDVTPQGWSYWVYVDTNAWNPDPFYIQLPFALGPVAEFADLIPVTTSPCTPDGSACAPLSIVGEVADLVLDVEALNVRVTDVEGDIATIEITLAPIPGQIAALQATESALVATVNIHTGQITALQAADTALESALHSSDAAWITTGILPHARLSGTIPENETVVLWNRPTLVSPGTAADSWRWLYNGTRTVYGNEYNLLRVRGVPEDQVPARFMSNFARDGLATGILQASLSDAATHLFQVLGNGSILGPGGLSMLPTGALAVTFNAAGAGNAATINDGNVANTGAPYPVTTTLEAANRRVHLDGSMANTSGVSIAAQTTLFTVDAAHRPTAWVQFTARTSTNLACRATVKGATGAFCLDQALAAGATVSFDGANWRKS